MGHTIRDPEPDISVYTASPTTLTAFKEKKGVKKEKRKKEKGKVTREKENKQLLSGNPSIATNSYISSNKQEQMQD